MGLTEIRLAEITAGTAAIQRIMGLHLKRDSPSRNHTGNNQERQQGQQQPRKRISH
jgi:hypothetical protein